MIIKINCYICSPNFSAMDRLNQDILIPIKGLPFGESSFRFEIGEPFDNCTEFLRGHEKRFPQSYWFYHKYAQPAQ